MTTNIEWTEKQLQNSAINQIQKTDITHEPSVKRKKFEKMNIEYYILGV